MAARDEPRGLWRVDRSLATCASPARLERNGVVFRKLFRRLTEFFGQGGQGLSRFLWLAGGEPEHVRDLTVDDITDFDDVLAIDGDGIRLTRRPEEIVFIGAETDRVEAAPWLAV